MAPSPVGSSRVNVAQGNEDLDPYASGWSGLNKLLRQGHSWSGNERHAAFLNLGRGHFAEVAQACGLDLADDGRALALIDWDWDGDQDLLLSNRSEPRLRILENRVVEAPSAFCVRPEDEDGNPLIGTRIEIGDPERPIVRALRAGEGYLAQSSRWLHFPFAGLAEEASQRVRVYWPGSSVPQQVDAPKRSGFYHLRRGTKRLVLGEERKRSFPDALTSIRANAKRETTRFVPAAPVPMPQLGIDNSKGGSLDLFGIRPGGEGKGTGRPVLLHVFASWCAPCVRELPQIVLESEALSESGIAFLALSVDEEGAGRDSARALMERLEWPFAWGFLHQDSAEVLDGLAGLLLDQERRLPLPTSFLVDPEGLLRAIYFGPVSTTTIRKDTSLFDLEQDAFTEAASPFSGPWHKPIAGTSLAWLARRFEARGLKETVREYTRGDIQVVQSSPADVIHGFGRAAASKGELGKAFAYFLQTLEKDPNHFDAQLDIGVLLHRQGKLKEAIVAYAKALRLRPQHVDLHFNLGLAYLALGDSEAARSEVRWLEANAPELATVLERELGKKR